MACSALTKFFDSISLNLSNACNNGRCCTSACCGGQMIVAERRDIPQNLQGQFSEAASNDDLRTAVDNVPPELQQGLRGRTVSAENAGNGGIAEGIVAFTNKALNKLKEGITQPNEKLKKREAWIRLDVAMHMARVNLQQKLQEKSPLIPVEAERLVDTVRIIRHRGSQAARIWNVFKERRPKTLAEFNNLAKIKAVELEVLKALQAGVKLEKDADVEAFMNKINAVGSFSDLLRIDMQLFFNAVSSLKPNGFVSWLSAEEIAEIGLATSPTATSGSSKSPTDEAIPAVHEAGGAEAAPAAGSAIVLQAVERRDDGAGAGAGVGFFERAAIELLSTALEGRGAAEPRASSAADSNRSVAGSENDDAEDGLDLAHRAAEDDGVEQGD